MNHPPQVTDYPRDFEVERGASRRRALVRAKSARSRSNNEIALQGKSIAEQSFPHIAFLSSSLEDY